jgi:3-oxoacyl-ACP reductase-like protein
MSILGDIITGIFGGPAKADEATPAPASTTSAAPTSPAPSTGKPAAPAASPAAAGSVDVAPILDDLAKKSEDKNLEWRKSIVDLMKILKLDSSLKARKALAKELHYTGSTKNSAEMNVWLHKQVMTKLVENGGKLPADLTS